MLREFWRLHALLNVRQTEFGNLMLIICEIRHGLLSKHLMEETSVVDIYTDMMRNQGVSPMTALTVKINYSLED